MPARHRVGQGRRLRANFSNLMHRSLRWSRPGGRQWHPSWLACKYVQPGSVGSAGGSYLLAAEVVGKRTPCEHSQRLGHFSEPLPVRYDLRTDSRLSVECNVRHVVNESLHRDDVTGDLLLELLHSSTSERHGWYPAFSYPIVHGGPVEDHAEDHRFPEDLDDFEASEVWLRSV